MAMGGWGGGRFFLVCDGKYFCQDKNQKVGFCNVSQQVLSGVVVMDNFMRTWIGT